MELKLTDDEVQLLQGALWEYMRARENNYIDRRYPLSEGYTENFRMEKEKSVAKNMGVAYELRKRLFPN